MKVNSIPLKTATGVMLGGVLLVCLFCCLIVDNRSNLLFRSAFAAEAGDDGHAQVHKHGAASRGAGFVISDHDGQIACREATPEEAQAIRRRDPDQKLRVITPASNELQQQQTGLKIILRGTPQLDGFPAAKDAFVKAAAKWEAIIQTPITIIIDVDYGPTRFGDPFGSNTIGSTDPQGLSGDMIYPTLRSRLIARASGAQETALYNALPTATVPTDIGSTAAIAAPSALFRALGFLNPTADPSSEPQFGDPPTIGFNSAFSFDFDPSDGVGSNQIDFDSTVVHEIGHALGFISSVGVKELDPDEAVSATVWDLFRFRPGVNLSNFATSQRILSSGGDHTYFDSGADLALSTGRINGQGGDGRQASHWKADEFTGTYIGIMDPSTSRGRRDLLTENDLRVIDTVGYQLRTIASQPGSAPVINAPATLDFGVVPANTRVDRPLTVRNTGTAVLNITGVTSLTSNFGVVAITNSFAVAPGGQETIIARFNPTASGNPTGSISITSNDPARSTLMVQVKATVGGATLPVSTVSAASFSGAALASEAIVAAFGQNLATRQEPATTQPLPFSLAGTTVRVRDSAGMQRDAPLFSVSPNQVNYQIPPGTENGPGTVTIISGAGSVSSGAVNIASVSPGLFTASSNGQGVAAAVALRVRANNSQVFEPVVRFDAGQNRFVSVPIDVAPAGEQVILLLFGTGVRFRSNLSAVLVSIGGSPSEVIFAGSQGGFAGLDQINVRLSPNLAGRGEVDLVLTVNGNTANTVKVNIR